MIWFWVNCSFKVRLGLGIKKQLGLGSEKMMLWLKIPGFVTTNTAGKRPDFLPQGRLEISRRWLKSSVKTGNCSQTAVSPS